MILSDVEIRQIKEILKDFEEKKKEFEFEQDKVLCYEHTACAKIWDITRPKTLSIWRDYIEMWELLDKLTGGE